MKGVKIKEFCESLEAALKTQLESVSQEKLDPIQTAARSRAVVKAKIDELKVFLHQYKFQDSSEEITFYKQLKPVLLSQYYFYDRLFLFRISEPVQKEALEDHCHSTLSRIKDHIKANHEFIGYCLSGSTHMDHLYFTRSNSFGADPLFDSLFSTGHDTALSNFLAHRLLEEHVQAVLRSLQQDSKSCLTWTTKKAYLVELVYALHEAKVFNDGKAGIKEIAALFENQFNANLGNYYRHFAEITVRKTNRTNFLDLLKEKLTRRLDQADH